MNKINFYTLFYSFLLLLLTACGNDNKGLPTGICGGDDNPCAAYPVQLVIAPVDIAVGATSTLPYQATVIFSDDSQQNVTQQTVWQSSEPSVATIDDSGLAITENTGMTIISASFSSNITGQSSVSAQTTLTVFDANLIALELTPITYETLVGSAVSYQAQAIYDDGYNLDVTEFAQWQSNNQAIASVSNNLGSKGQVLANGVGEVNIEVNFAQLNNTAQLVVLDSEPVNLLIAPENAQVPLATSLPYQAFVILADNSAIDVTLYTDFTLTDSNLGAFDNNQVFTGLVQGETEVNASFTYGNVSFTASTPVAVTAATAERLVILPQDESFPNGSQGRYQALAYFSDGQVTDVTDRSTWQLADALGEIVESGANAGFAKAEQVGQTQVLAQFLGLSSETSVTITEAVLVELSISPVNVSTPLGTQINYQATARFSDQSTQDATTLGFWRSSEPSIANITTTGMAIGEANALAVGTTDICFDYLALSTCTPLEVTSAVATGLQITPMNTQVPLGTQGQYQATAFFSDGHSEEVTALTSWSIDDSSIALITPKGDAAGFTVSKGVGETTVSASYAGLVASTSLMVTDAELSELVISPVSARVAAGNSQSYNVYGVYSDGSSKELTSQASWQGSNDDIAYLNQQGVATSVAVGEITVMATVQSLQMSATLIVSDAVLTRLAVVPKALTLAAGNEGQLSATAYFSDLSSQDVTEQVTWFSDDKFVAVINPEGVDGGLVLGVGVGETKATASYQGIEDNAAITVTAALLEDVTISPKRATAPVGVEESFVLTARFSDDSTLVVTDKATWQSSEPNYATVNNQGLASTHSQGVTSIMGSYQGLSDSAELDVTEAIVTELQVSPITVSVPQGTNGDFVATAFYSDGQTSDVTAQALWQSTDNSIASVVNSGENAGQGLAESVGMTEVSATFAGFTQASEVTVTAAVLEQLLLSPEQDSSYVGGISQYQVIGVYSDDTSKDHTTDVSWSSTDSGIAFVNQTGEATGVSAGETIITASYLDKTSNNGYLAIGDAIVERIVVHPTPQNVANGQLAKFKLHAYLSDGSDNDVTDSATWQALDTSIASHDGGGVFQSLALGETEIRATYKGQESSGLLSVSAAVLEQLTIAPITASIIVDESIAFQSFAVFSDDSNQEVTAESAWQISESIASIDTVGTVTGYMPGQATVSVSYGGQTVEASLTVEEKPIVSISVVPIETQAQVGASIAYVAYAVHPDASTTDISQLATWSSSDNGIASIITSGGEGGLATAKASGVIDISAVYKGQSGQGELEVLAEDPVITALLIEPTNIEMIINTEQQLSAYAVYENDLSTKVDVTADTQWSFDDEGFAVFTTPGNVLATSVGGTFIQVTYQGLVQKTSLNVRNEPVESVEISPSQLSVPVDTVGRFTATAYYISGRTEDVTDKATWSVLKSDIVHIVTSGVNGGQATALAEGSSPIFAKYDGERGSGSVTVLGPEIISVYIQPEDIEVDQGGNVQVRAYAELANAEPLEISAEGSWVSGADGIAQISGAGSNEVYLNGVSAGETTLKFSYKGKQAEVNVTVSSLPLESISIDPEYPVVPQQYTVNYKATGHYQGGITKDITDLVTWGVDDEKIASISQQGGTLVTNDIGETRVFATFNNLSDETYLEVSEFYLYNIEIEPDPIIMQVGQTLQFTCYALFRLIDNDDFTQRFDITDTAQWVLIFASPIGNFVGQGLFEAKNTGNNAVGCRIDNGDGSFTVGERDITVN